MNTCKSVNSFNRNGLYENNNNNKIQNKNIFNGITSSILSRSVIMMN